MTARSTFLAPHVQAFFTQHLCQHKQASPQTIASYRDTFRLLLHFAERRLKKAPSALGLADLDAPLVGAFLHHVENERGNSARSRNVRLAAIRSFFRYAALQEPEHAGLIQRVLAMPNKRFERRPVDFLVRPEIDALLGAPDRSTWAGRRDHALRPHLPRRRKELRLTGALSADWCAIAHQSAAFAPVNFRLSTSDCQLPTAQWCAMSAQPSTSSGLRGGGPT